MRILVCNDGSDPTIIPLDNFEVWDIPDDEVITSQQDLDDCIFARKVQVVKDGNVVWKMGDGLIMENRNV